MFDTSLVSVQQGSRDCGVLFSDVADGFCLCEESSDGVCLIARLALCEDRLSGFAKAAVRHVQGEFATARTIKQVSRRRDLMVRWRGVTE
jgi:hypothetical protein